MHTYIYRKVFFHLSLFGVAVSILVGMYDVIFDHLFEGIHILFEMVESSIDKLVEHVFETEMRETQIIVFYILLTIAGFLIYFVWKALVHLCKGFGQNLKADWIELKDAVIQDWKSLTIINRVILICVFLLVNYLASFFLF